jgi:hypothetical protein
MILDTAGKRAWARLYLVVCAAVAVLVIYATAGGPLP